ncbi:DUF1010 domain-containing protein [Melaminivora jejuensis]|uniref:DUF1010 domain-containing protein n=1 Tax=Melaminivora jejuensis TaxID=1267217 RepID=UPI001E5EF3DA|nr:DUF1010 domain-containing protein [Melaminivora jejuensis]UHJ65680.1 DUF1010 domain-containing protein [Melaminivora jejuensis]
MASSPCAANASSYCFRSAAQPWWRCAFSQFAPFTKFRLPVLAYGSNHFGQAHPPSAVGLPRPLE